MHAVYCFLTGENPLEEFLDAVSTGIFPLDENNWYQEMVAVAKNGELTQYCDENDWRGRDWLGKKFAALPPEERWKTAIEFAESCVEWEVGQSIQMLVGKYSDSEGVKLEIAEPQIRQTLQKYALQAKPWALNLASQSIVQLEYREGPFTRSFTDAYSSLRAIALTEKSIEDEDVAILCVDIHT
jgi:hypothetical protein